MMSGGVGGGSGSSTSLSRQYQQQGSLLSPTLSTGSEHHPHHPYASSPQPIATHRFQRPSFLYPAPPSSSSSSASSSNIIFPHLHHPNQARLQAQTRPDRSYSLSSSLPTHTASYWNQLAQPPVPPVVSQRQNLVFNPNIPTLYEAFPPSFSSLAPPSPAPLSFSPQPPRSTYSETQLLYPDTLSEQLYRRFPSQQHFPPSTQPQPSSCSLSSRQHHSSFNGGPSPSYSAPPAYAHLAPGECHENDQVYVKDEPNANEEGLEEEEREALQLVGRRGGR
jgi:hypothetical protein